jgi:large subunit ribosomal protein L24e
MPIKRLCSFCGNEIEPGTGKMFVRRDGTVFFFCKSKCQRNLLHLGRVPRTVRWTRAAIQAKARAKGLAVEESRLEAVAADEAEAPVAESFTIQIPKGKAVPAAIRDLIERRLGPGLSATEIEGKFKEFSNSTLLREFLGVWYGKRHPKKKVSEVELSEYVAFLDTSAGKKVLKDWLEGEAKKEKVAKEA